MRNLKSLEWLAIILVIIGGLNWGLVGLFDFNLVDAIFGAGSVLSRIIYTLVALSAIYLAAISPSLHKRTETAAMR